jgi:Peptidase family M28
MIERVLNLMTELARQYGCAMTPRHFSMRRIFLPVSPLCLGAMLCLQANGALANAGEKPRICDACIQSDMNFFASDELRGRGSGTRDEHIAALFVASQFASFGLEPGGDSGSFLQKAPLPSPLPSQVQVRLHAYENVPRTETWNVVGILRGSHAGKDEEAILLTAHLDHLGVGPNVKGDTIYNGADDDASGTTAVIELARALVHRKRPRRTILFVLFGSEELGGFGNDYFLKHPPVPLDRIVANLEFEMIGRLDPSIPANSVWMTGYERSNLGSELLKHGANIVADPRPKQEFFRRSDNYALAKDGVVAHTISSFGLHSDYHQPSDDLSHIDFTHMKEVISSMLKPIEWLSNTEWKPTWNVGGKP